MKCTWNTVFLIPLLNAPYNRHPVWHLRNQPFWPPTAAWKSILNRPKSAPKCHASFYLKQYEPSNEFKIRSCLKTAIMHTSFKLAWAANMKNWQRKKWCMHFFFTKYVDPFTGLRTIVATKSASARTTRTWATSSTPPAVPSTYPS